MRQAPLAPLQHPHAEGASIGNFEMASRWNGERVLVKDMQ